MARAKLLARLPVRLAGSILVLSAAALIGLTELGRRAVERLLLQQAEVQAALSTAAVADGLDAVIGSAERTARLLARELAGRPLDAAVAEQRGRDVLLEFPNLHSCILALNAEAGGPPVAIEVRRAEASRRFDARDLLAPGGAWPPPWYPEVIEKGLPVWSDPYLDPVSGRNAVRVAVPVRRDPGEGGEPAGVVALTLDLEWLRRLANLQEFADTSFTIVFSRSGRLILHPRPTYIIAETIDTLAQKVGAPELVDIRRNLLARRQGVLRYTEAFPARRVHVNYKSARTAGWGIIVGFDEAEFLQTQRSYRLISFGVLAGLLVLLTAIVVIVTHLALRPLSQLEFAAGEIARGHLDGEIAVPRRQDEVGRLARSFAAMQAALRHQELERRWAAQAIEHQLRYHQLIVDSMHEMVFVLTKTLRISRANPAAMRATGQQTAALLQMPLTHFVRLADEAANAGDVLIQALKEERTVEGLAVFLRQQDGVETRMRLNLVPIRDAGRVVGGVATLRPSPDTNGSTAQ